MYDKFIAIIKRFKKEKRRKGNADTEAFEGFSRMRKGKGGPNRLIIPTSLSSISTHLQIIVKNVGLIYESLQVKSYFKNNTFSAISAFNFHTTL